MPAINFLPRYTEALQFWLPMYITGRVKVYYYPRLRDNLYRRSMIVVPDHCVRISPNTMPRELLELLIPEIHHPGWKSTFQAALDEIAIFESNLNKRTFIDMVRLATAEEVRSGKVYVASPFETYPGHPRYTPETYALHLKNILRLMDQYDDYYFVPYYDSKWESYNLIVNSDGLALVVRTSAPPLMLEIRRPEMVMACQEHLLRKAEKVGYEGIHKSKIRHQVMDLIKALEN